MEVDESMEESTEQTAEQTAEQLAKLYSNRYAIGSRYPSTSRPVTTMKFTTSFCVPGLYLPVVRYENIYYQSKTKPEGKEYCGTFYYYEPHSINSISLGKTLVTSNKLHAVVELERKYFSNFRHPIRDLAMGNIPMSLSAYLLLLAWKLIFNIPILEFGDLIIDIKDIQEISDIWIDSKKSNEYPNYLLNNNPSIEVNINSRKTWENIKRVFMKQSVLEQLDVTYNLMTSLITNERNIPVIATNKYDEINPLYYVKSELIEPSHKIYIASHPGTSLNYIGYKLYSLFDYVDQIICQLAYELGYDTIILQREPGKERPVTEILDVRPRHLSYGSFCRGLNTTPFRKAVDTSGYPTIWFTDYGARRKE